MFRAQTTAVGLTAKSEDKSEHGWPRLSPLTSVGNLASSPSL